MIKEKLLYYLSMQFQKWVNKDGDLFNEEIKHILVIKWDEIGDMASALHVFELLKGSHPNSKITLHCKPFVKSLVETNPFIDSIVTDINEVDFTSGLYDTIIELRGTPQTFKKVSRKNTNIYLGRGTVRYKNRGDQKHETVTNYEIIAPILKPGKPPVAPKIYPSKETQQEIEGFLKDNGITKFAVLHTLARAKLRQWPLKRFAKTAHYLSTKYNLQIVLACAPEETDLLANELELFPKNTVTFSGKTGLVSFAALCNKAAIFIGNESGPLQIASAFTELPIIALFGPGVPNVFYPIGLNKKVLHYVLDCNPCDQIKCVQPENKCIDMISEMEVKEAIDGLISV